jgi:FkbM family methyltransferase
MLARFLSRLLAGVHFRGKAGLLHRLAPRTGTVEHILFGYSVTLSLSDYMQRAIWLGVYEPQETRVFANYVKPGMTVIDAGANVGYYSLLAASKGCTVYAFEPSPGIFQELCANIERNRIGSIHALDAGLSDANIVMKLPTPSAENHTPSLLDETATEYVDVQLMRLGEYLSERGINRVDLLKMDVEGFEPNILTGAVDALEDGHVGAIFCELNDYWLRQNNSTPQELFDQICSFGFAASEPLLGHGGQTILFTR